MPLKLRVERGHKMQKPESDSPKDSLEEPEDEERSGGDLAAPLAEEKEGECQGVSEHPHCRGHHVHWGGRCLLNI